MLATETLATQLQEEEAASFVASWNDLMSGINSKSEELTAFR